jgi:hypothetical protein
LLLTLELTIIGETISFIIIYCLSPTCGPRGPCHGSVTVEVGILVSGQRSQSSRAWVTPLSSLDSPAPCLWMVTCLQAVCRKAGKLRPCVFLWRPAKGAPRDVASVRDWGGAAEEAPALPDSASGCVRVDLTSNSIFMKL